MKATIYGSNAPVVDPNARATGRKAAPGVRPLIENNARIKNKIILSLVVTRRCALRLRALRCASLPQPPFPRAYTHHRHRIFSPLSFLPNRETGASHPAESPFALGVGMEVSPRPLKKNNKWDAGAAKVGAGDVNHDLNRQNYEATTAIAAQMKHRNQYGGGNFISFEQEN